MKPVTESAAPLEGATPASSGLRDNDGARFPAVLGVVGHAPHWIGPDGRAWAYEPYVREMRIWADLFRRVRLCSPAGVGPMRGNLAAYERSNVEWCPVDYPLTPGLRGAVSRLRHVPGLLSAAGRMVCESDFVLLRSPGHFGMVGALWVRALRKRSLTKWAGENGAYEHERLPAKLERWLQAVPSSLHPVLVYGPPKRPHQIEAMPALMTDDELETARAFSHGKVWAPPWRLLSVGRLDPVKGFDLAIRGLGELARTRPEIAWTYELIGDGPAGPALRELVAREGLGTRVALPGARTFPEVQRHYGAAHVAIMPGTKEGWPKVIAEAWAHGAVPVAARGGSCRGSSASPGRAACSTRLRGTSQTRSRRSWTRPARWRCPPDPDLNSRALSPSPDSQSLVEGVLVHRCGL